MASLKVEEYTKDSINWKTDNWRQSYSDKNGYNEEFKGEQKGWNSSWGGQSSCAGNNNSCISSSWDDWDTKDKRKEDNTKVTASHCNDGWGGWDDAKDDGYDQFYSGSSGKKAGGHNTKSDYTWTVGGFL